MQHFFEPKRLYCQRAKAPQAQKLVSSAALLAVAAAVIGFKASDNAPPLRLF
jgi:hypothetical protein